jgi:hydrogenase maturation protease
VLGIGNPDRGDDAAGRAAAGLLRGVLPDHVEVAQADGEATDLVGRLERRFAAFIIDACASGAPAGTLHRFDVAAAPLPHAAFSVSSHGLGLHHAIELSRALGQLPPRCIVYAIEGEAFETGAPMSPAVLAAIRETAERVKGEPEAAGLPQEPRHA